MGTRLLTRAVARVLGAAMAGSLVAGLALVAVPPSTASAATCDNSWNIAGSGAWSTGGNWSAGHVPTSAENVCLGGTTTYTVTIDFDTAVAKSIKIGGTGGNQTLAIAANCGSHASLTVSANSSLTARGRATLDSVSCGNRAAIFPATSTAPTLTNAGIITSLHSNGNGGLRLIELSTTNNGTINDTQSISTITGLTFLNQGAINIDDSQTFDWSGGDFTNGTGGSISSTGTTGMLTMSGGTFHEGAGTTSGAPPQLTDTNIDYTGSGASTLIARGGDQGGVTLTGNISAGQTLDMWADCGRQQQRDVAASFSNAGTINFDSVSCGNHATLFASSNAVVLTNTGTINSNATNGNGGARNLDVSTTNNGTVNVHFSMSDQSTNYTFVNHGAINVDDGQVFDWTNGTFTNGSSGSIASTGTTGTVTMAGGTFHEGAGTTSGAPPVLTDTNIDYTGSGASTLIARGGDQTGITLSGNIAASQTLDLWADCNRHQERDVAASFTNAGTINFDSVSCGNHTALIGASNAVVLTNTGTINSNATNGNAGARDLDISTTNNGTVNVHFTMTNQSGTETFVNQGAINVDDGQVLDWTGGDFTNGAGGSISSTGTTGTVTMAGGTFHEGAGTTSGAPPVLTDTNVDYTGSGASTLIARGGDQGGITLSGNLAAGQTLDLWADCNRHVSRTASASFTNAGTINLDSVSCGNHSSLLGANNSVVLTNSGTINSNSTNGNTGTRNVGLAVTNTGTINVNYPLKASGKHAFNMNAGTLNLNHAGLGWGSGAFTLAGGTIASHGGAVSGSGLFTQGNGNATGAAPISRTGSIAYTGTGSSKITKSGLNGTLSGTLVSGQTLTVAASCKTNSAIAISSNVTNGGTIVLKSASCGNNASLTSPSGTPVLTNNGTILTDASNTGQRNLEVSIVNNGTITVNQSADAVVTRTFTNNGTITVANGMAFDWENGDFTNAAGGTIAGGTSGFLLVNNGGTYHQGDGATTGTSPVIVDNANIDFNGTAAAAASLVIAHGDVQGTLTGTIQANQSLALDATCLEHVKRTTTAAFTNKGSITLESVSCGNNITIDASAGTFTNAGTVTVSDTGGGHRTIIGNVVNNKTFVIGAIGLTHTGSSFRSNAAGSNIAVRVASAGSFGTINSSGGFTIGGKFTINTDAGFWPSNGQDYPFLNGTTALSGTFASFAGLTRTGQSVSYHVHYGPNSVDFTVS